MNRAFLKLAATAAVAAAAWPAAARACPVCGAGTGREVRAALSDGRMGDNLVATLLPFPVVLGVVAAIHFGGGGRRPGRQRTRPVSRLSDRDARGPADASSQPAEDA